jgi:hypothetical protein
VPDEEPLTCVDLFAGAGGSARSASSATRTFGPHGHRAHRMARFGGRVRRTRKAGSGSPRLTLGSARRLIASSGNGPVSVRPTCSLRRGDVTQPLDYGLASAWLRRAEKLAGLEKLERGTWHPYRRKWATARKHLPLADVAAAGGWQGRP